MLNPVKESLLMLLGHSSRARPVSAPYFTAFTWITGITDAHKMQQLLLPVCIISS
jgi:hypothetical protein